MPLFPLLLRQHRLHLLLLAAATLLGGAVAAWPPLLTRTIIDTALPGRDGRALAVASATLAVALAAKAALRAWQEYTGARLGLALTGDLRRRLWRSLMEAPLTFFTATPRGEILQRLLSDAEALQGALVQAAPRALYEVTAALAALAAMFWIDPALTGMAVGLLVLAALPGRRVGQVQQDLSRETRQRQAELYQQAQERLEAARLVKSFAAEEREAARFRTLQLAWARLQLKAFLSIQAFMNVPRTMDTLVPMLAYLAGGYRIAGGSLSLGELVAFVGYLPLAGAPLRSLSSTFLTLRQAAPRLAAVAEWLDLPAEPARTPSRASTDLSGEIVFDNVSFTYPGAPASVLDGASFRIPAGARVGVVGPSGAGKSTIMALLARLYEPDAGRITVGGRPLAEIHAADLRPAMAVVTQETFLLHDTVRRNLTFGLRQPVTDTDLWAALDAASLRETVEALPQGLDTPVGERGLRLSGGERQRLAIARAYLRNPAVLLLDEATSALDNETQAVVQAALGRMAAGRTTLAVAHRLSTLAGADLVFEVRDGQVREVQP